MKTAVVTGASGAVGYGLINVLLQEGVSVTVLGRTAPEAENVNFIKCDLSELAQVQTEPADCFFHLAWNGTYGAARNDREAQFKNVDYTLDAVELAHRIGCKAFVGVGSQAEYGVVANGVRLTPDLLGHPANAYGTAKKLVGQLAGERCKELSIKFNWCRIISAYGPGDKPYTMVMQTVANFAAGKSCDFTAGNQIWDYMYNEDLGRALYLIAEKGADGAVYVAGSGEGKPLREYIEAIYRAVGNHDAVYRFGAIPYFENQPMYLVGDIGKLSADTGFVPQVTFDEGIKKTVQYYRGKQDER